MSDKVKGRFPIDMALVRRLVDSQFPDWAHLAIRPISAQGNDNRTFRLGDRLSVRLPSAERYVSGVEKEQRWLPLLAPHLPVQIPAPVALGRPSETFPWPWSIYQWLEGETAAVEAATDQTEFASALSHFLVALQRIDASDGPIAGVHSFFRGAPLRIYDEQTRASIATLRGLIDDGAALEVWDVALASVWSATPVWFHGDVALTNLLVLDGRLAGVIDFGTCGVGDPACDLTIAWTFFAGESRAVFKATLCLDDSTWARGRGWALWKALTLSAWQPEILSGRKQPTIWTHNPTTGSSIIDEIIADHRRSN